MIKFLTVEVNLYHNFMHIFYLQTDQTDLQMIITYIS